MLAYVNGQYVPADRPVLTVNDRSFLYGDGLFETIRITNGQPFLWREHLDRLRRGAEFLKIAAPFTAVEIEFATRHLLAQNDMPEGMVRIHLSRGPGGRGYAIASATNSSLVITTHKSLHTPHPGLNVITSTVRILAGDPLTQYKTANRLPNILARAEADAANADEALISNNRDRIAEASGANIFIARGDKILTPPLCAGALAGTTREFILRIAGESSVTATEEDLTVADLYAADSAFLCSAHWLVAPIISLDGRAMQTKGAATVKALRQACEQAALGR